MTRDFVFLRPLGLRLEKFDWTITLCGDARDKCPLFSGGGQRVHIGFSDPAKATGTEEEIMEAFRRVRDEIKDALTGYFMK